jgi:hypothetical protein
MISQDVDDALSCACPQSCLCCGPKFTFRNASWFLYTSSPSCKSFLPASCTPTPLERQRHIERVSSARAELQYLSQKRAYITQLLAEVDAEVAEIESVVGIYESLVSPIQLLPFDILHQIFTLYQEDRNGIGKGEGIHTFTTGRYRNPAPFRVLNGPWQLGRVCSKWRDAILSMPTLWSTITLLLFGPHGNVPNGTRRLLCEGLSRSRECPLIVNILTFVNLAVSSELLLMLSAHSARFKELAVYFGKGPSHSASTTLAFLESRCQGQFPALERLALFVVSPPQENNLPYPSLFSNAPKLRMVELGIERPADALDLPWQQLKTIRLHSYSKATRKPIFNPSISTISWSLFEDVQAWRNARWTKWC